MQSISRPRLSMTFRREASSSEKGTISIRYGIAPPLRATRSMIGLHGLKRDVPTRITRRSWREALRSVANAASSISPSRSASRLNITPASVNITPRGERSKSFTPTSDSRESICFITDTVDTKSFLEAFAKLSDSATTRNVFTLLSIKPNDAPLGINLCLIHL